MGCIGFKLFRFFLDFYEERNYLIKKVYPKLKDYCQTFSLDLQVN
jgi:hypothetical protein